MSELIMQSADRLSTDTRWRRSFIQRMHHKLAVKQAAYSDGENHRFSSNNLSPPVDFSL
ncbi:MAG TPA: hypothetical protein VMQ52_04610 [Candidatus Saccharimonadales bacterium]|jgi:hypothetical protein|nr:hypothetical protein [Candidatus Saccharimonadales bacterium]